MARPNGKSVRLSDEALAIVNSAPGEGFNDKFEGLIFAYSQTIPQRKAEVDILDRQIKQKRNQLEGLRSLEQKMNYMVRNLNEMCAMIPNLANSLESVSREVVQVSTGLKVNEIQKFKQLQLPDED